jgi:membrane protease YdiL (CAAX protease family)
MIKAFFQIKELNGINWKIILVVIISTLVLIASHYNPISQIKEIDHFLYYMIFPLCLVILVFRENPSTYGFRIGEWKIGLKITAIGALVCLLIADFVAQTSDFKGYYAPQNKPMFLLFLSTGLDLIGWEFLFRGLLLFALLPICGPYAILIQAIPFTIAHIGKPEIETLSCIFGGSIFGIIAWRTRSFLYPFLIHWFLAFLTIVFAATK